MANKPLKRCSTSGTSRELHIKSTMWYQHTSIRMTKTPKFDNTKCWQRYRTTRAPIHFWREYRMVQPLRKIVCQLPTKLNILLPYDLAIVLLGIYASILKTSCLHKTWRVYSIFIHNSPQMEAAKMSFNVWLDKQTEIHPHYGILFSNFLKNEFADHQRHGGAIGYC